MSNATARVEMAEIAPSQRALFLEMANQYFSELNPAFVPADDWKAQYFEIIRANPAYFLRWITSDGERAGFILFGVEDHKFLPRKTGVINEVYVAPQFRRQGVARECVLQAIAELWSLGSSKIQIELVGENAGGAAFWRTLQFQKVSERLVLTKERR